MLRTTRGSPIVPASAVKRSRDDPDTAHSSGASAARNTWRKSSISSVASCWGPQPPASSALERDEDTVDVTVGQGVEHRGELGPGGVGGPRRHHLVQGRERVTGGAPPTADRRLERSLAEVEPGLAR